MRSIHPTRCTAIVVALLLLTFYSAQGQSQRSSLPDEAPEVATTGSITGRVINENGQPLPNAAVSIRSYGSLGPPRAINTDREGAFQASGLDRVAYQIFASAPAYATQPRDPDSTQAPYYRVGDSVTLVLLKGGVITGTVTTAGEEPVVGIRVRAQMIRDGNGQPSRYGATIRERSTDDRGVYRIYGLLTGTYLVSAGGGGGGGWGWGNAYDTDAPTYAPASGRDTAGEISVRAGEETTNVDIRYRAEQGRIVSGIASGPQPPDPSGFSLTLSSVLDGGSQWNNQYYQYPGSRGFVFSGVADGDYDVTAQSYFPEGERTLSEPYRVKVRGADITGIELTTKPLGAVSGRVVLEGSKAPDCKNKRRPLLTETLISAWHNEKIKAKDQPQFIWSLGAPSSPDNEGNFLLRNLAAGQYQFIPRFSAKYWYLHSISLQTSAATAPKPTAASREVDAARNWTTVKTSERLSELVIKLAEGAASLQGKISLGEAEKLPARLYVYLLPAEREKIDDVLRFFAAPVLSDGKIMMNNLAPGRYLIVAQPATDMASSPLSKLRLPDETETRAKLRREAEALKTEIEFKPCQNVTDYQLPLNSSLTAAPKTGLVGP